LFLGQDGKILLVSGEIFSTFDIEGEAVSKTLACGRTPLRLIVPEGLHHLSAVKASVPTNLFTDVELMVEKQSAID
jgi:hypothetical protein